MAKMKVPVTARALVQRINRALAKQNLCIKKTRGADVNLGEYFELNTQKNFITNLDVDIESLGRDLKVLRNYEVLKG